MVVETSRSMPVWNSAKNSAGGAGSDPEKARRAGTKPPSARRRSSR